MGWGTFRHLINSFSLSILVMLAFTSCKQLGANQTATSFTYTVAGYNPKQGYADETKLITVTGTNLKASDTLLVGGNICAPDVLLTTTTTFVCTLPILCISSGACTGIAGESLAVTYNQDGQIYDLATYLVPAYSNPGKIPVVTHIGVHRPSAYSTDLKARAVLSSGGQYIFFTFAYPLVYRLVAVTIGSTGGGEKMQCMNIVTDGHGANYYQCLTTAWSGVVPGTTRDINFYFDDGVGSALTYPTSFYVLDVATPYTTTSMEALTDLCVAGTCLVSTTVNPVSYP